MIQYTKFNINLYFWEWLNVIDKEMHTLEIVACYLSYSDSKSMLVLSLTYSLLAGWWGWGLGVLEEEQRPRLQGRPPISFFSFVLTHTHALTQTQDARNGGDRSSPDWSSESSEMHGK